MEESISGRNRRSSSSLDQTRELEGYLVASYGLLGLSRTSGTATGGRSEVIEGWSKGPTFRVV
jgi:hypothetical protein